MRMFLLGLVSCFIFSSAFGLVPAKTKINEFVFNNGQEPETLDPHAASGVYANTILIQMFEGLMSRDSDWQTLIPGQAKSYKISDDKKTYTFYLRKNLKWSDGSALTAHDFVYSWIRSVHPDTLNSLSYWVVDNIVGAQNYAEKPTEENKKKFGVRALDKHTFEVRLKHPLAYFLQLTALAAFFPVKKSVVEKFGSQWFRPEYVVSNGPYVLSEWKVNEKIVLKRNPHYYDAQSIRIEKIEALPIANPQAAVGLFKQGRLDWTGLTGAPNASVPLFAKQPNFRVSPGFVSYFFRLNTTRPPLNDKRVRQALALSINRKEIVEKITRAGEVASTHFVPVGAGSYQSPKGIISGSYAENLVRARELLKEAGFTKDNPMRELTINYNTDENNKKIALAVQNMWKKSLGVRVKLYNQEWKVHLKTQEALDYDISRNGWAGYYPDASAFLEVFTSSSNVNQTGWSHANYDRLFKEANQMQNGASRLQKLQEVESVLLEELPLIPLYTYSNFGFLRPELKGFPQNKPDRPFVKYFYKE